MQEAACGDEVADESRQNSSESRHPHNELSHIAEPAHGGKERRDRFKSRKFSEPCDVLRPGADALRKHHRACHRKHGVGCAGSQQGDEHYAEALFLVEFELRRGVGYALKAYESPRREADYVEDLAHRLTRRRKSRLRRGSGGAAGKIRRADPRAHDERRENLDYL